MKKIVLLILMVVTLCSCSKETETTFAGSVKDGLYAFYGQRYAVLIGTGYKDGWNFETNCYPGYITITDLITGEYVFNQINEITYIEQKDGLNTYNGWSYKNGLSILCVPVSENSFTGVILSNSSNIDLPNKMDFNMVE